MKLTAQQVQCTSAIGGEILQVMFAEKDYEPGNTRYVLIDRAFEFSGVAGCHWRDRGPGGTQDIRDVILNPHKLSMKINGTINFEIAFELGVNEYDELSRYVSDIFDSKQITGIEPSHAKSLAPAE